MYLVYYQIIKSYDLHTIFQFVESKYGVFVLESIGEYVKISKRIEKYKNYIFIITTCLQNGVLPNFSIIVKLIGDLNLSLFIKITSDN